MRTLLLLFLIKIGSCGHKNIPPSTPPTLYYFDVNTLHEPLTTFDKASKTVKYCVHINNSTLDLNYLLGTWYTIFEFGKHVTGLENDYCKVTNYTRPTKQDLDGYKAKYNIQNETFVFDDSVLSSVSLGTDRTMKGLVVGDKTAKYYFLEPKSRQRLSGMYEVLTFKRVNNDYMIYYECNMRGHIKYLWSKKRNQTDEELENIIKPLIEVQGKRERFCKKRKVVSTTPYF